MKAGALEYSDSGLLDFDNMAERSAISFIGLLST